MEHIALSAIFENALEEKVAHILSALGWRTESVESVTDLEERLTEEKISLLILDTRSTSGFNEIKLPYEVETVIFAQPLEEIEEKLSDRSMILFTDTPDPTIRSVFTSITKNIGQSITAVTKSGATDRGDDSLKSRKIDFFLALGDTLNVVTSSKTSLADKLNSFLTIALDFLDAKRGSIMLMEGEDTLVVRAASHSEIVGAVQKLEGNSVASRAVRENRTIHNPGSGGKQSEKGKYESDALLTIPICFQDNVIGVINVTDRVDQGRFRIEDDVILSVFSGLLISALLAKEVENERDKLKTVNEELSKLQRLKQNLTEMLVHDLKGPTGEIMANLNMLESDIDDGFQKDALDDASNAINDLFGMIINILDVNKMEEGRFTVKPEKLDLVKLVASSVARIEKTVERDEKKIFFHPQESILEILADREITQRVIWNILSNANNHTSSGDTITVHLSSENGFATISLSDTGAGITPEDQKKIFDKYSQAPGSTAKYSSGLGLTFCKMAMDAHSGKIEVESESGKGATFRLYFPL